MLKKGIFLLLNFYLLKWIRGIAVKKATPSPPPGRVRSEKVYLERACILSGGRLGSVWSMESEGGSPKLTTFGRSVPSGLVVRLYRV